MNITNFIVRISLNLKVSRIGGVFWMEIMEVGIGEDELGQGPWEEEGSGKCIFLPLNWIHRKPYHKRVSWLRG